MANYMDERLRQEYLQEMLKHKLAMESIPMGVPRGTISSTHISPGNPLASQAQDWEKKVKEQEERVETLELAVEKLITMNNDLRSDLDRSTKYLLGKLIPLVEIKPNDSLKKSIDHLRGRYHDTP